MLNMDSEEVACVLNHVRENLHRCHKALTILEAGSSASYQQAFETLLPDTRKLFEGDLADEEYKLTSEDLRRFLTKVMPDYYKRVDLLVNHSSIMAQAHGESLDPERLDNLSRYEVFLDRKLERTLAMLLKLQALRRARDPAIE